MISKEYDNQKADNEVLVLDEDFRNFRIGDFPYETLHGAMGAYHYRPAEWYCGRWYDPIPGPGKEKSWMIVEDDHQKYIE